MTFTVQDDTGEVDDANAYVTVAFFKAYHTDRGGSYSAYSDTQIEQAVVRATDYLDNRFTFDGTRKAVDQTTEFPKEDGDLQDKDGNDVDGVPLVIQRATAEYALRALSLDLLPDQTGTEAGRIASKSSTVGPISTSVSYVNGAIPVLPKFPLADAMLAKTGWVTGGLSSLNGRTIRG